MASGILANIKEEVTCPICLELLTEPLSLDCRHTFCQACITANSKEIMISQEGESSCPVCQISYQPGNLQPNWHVANIVKKLKEVKLNPEEEQKTDLCEHHGEKLLLFCKEDGKFICWLCERSQEHRGHHTFLMEEVVQEYKEKLQAALDRLRAEQQKAEKLKDDITVERASWEAESELVQQSQSLKELISDLEHRLQGSTMKMLQDVNGIMERSKTFTLKKPKTVSKNQRRVFQVPDLSEMLQVFNGLRDMRCYWVHMTLDPLRKKSNVVISANRREVRCVLDCNAKRNQKDTHQKENYDIYAVLGLPAITSGKHYWEVDVSQKHAWVLGVCGETWPDWNMPFVKKGKNYEPKYGYWVIALNSQFEYNAFEQSLFSCPPKVTLKLTVPPNCIGVFLDYEAGTVSFLNVTNHGFLIYKFFSCSFSHKIYPYFNPMNCTGPMTVCSPSS
ncbi:tripartite motif-containing protein 5-like isoform X2 [Phyllostomus hastatus]|uniref:tripartite motif-containing protein 5-like isoform X2 n=1 Tax=Phyllostomus hastatus TaxID=9423 RepID=UPI001E6806C1|nr:tripartite motif-containing protein 5-like isoform X2 [Phyllostomus hastatus]